MASAVERTTRRAGLATRRYIPLSSAWRQGALAIALLLPALLLGYYLRMLNFTPPQVGLLYAADHDESVYFLASQLTLQGHVAYRDFFFTQPPLAIYSFLPPLLLHYHLWGSLEQFMDLRYYNVWLSLGIIALAFFIAGRLGGWGAATIAGLLVALDGLNLETNRHSMQEQPMTLFTGLAMLAYLHALPGAAGRRRTGLLALAGVFSAMAVLTKTAGLAVLAALALYSITSALRLDPQDRHVTATRTLSRRIYRTSSARSQQNDLFPLLGGFASAFFLLLLPYLLLAPGQMLRDVYLFQLLRPLDGSAFGTQEIIRAVLTSGRSRLTIAGAALGLLAWLTLLSGNKWLRPRPLDWLLPVLWLGCTAAVLLSVRSFYYHYYVQLGLPLAVLAGALFDWRILTLLVHNWRHSRLASLAGVGIYALLLASALVVIQSSATTQWQQTVRTTTIKERAYLPVAQIIAAHSQAGEKVMAYEPEYLILARRAPAGATPGTFLVDEYGEVLSANLAIPSSGLRVLIARLFHDHPTRNVVEVRSRPAGQHLLRAAIGNAGLAVLAREQYNALARLDPALAQRLVEVGRYNDTLVYRVQRATGEVGVSPLAKSR